MIFYSSTIFKRAVLSTFYYAVIIVVEVIVEMISMRSFAIPYIDFVNLNNYYLGVGYFSRIIILSIIFILKRIISQNEFGNYITTKDWIIIITQPVVSILIIFSIVDLMAAKTEVSPLITISVVGLLLSDFLTFLLIESVNSKSKAMYETTIFEKQLKAGLQSIEELSQAHERQHGLMHDYNNQLETIQGLLEKNSFENAKDYIYTLLKNADENVYTYKTNSDVVDVIINNKELYAKNTILNLNLTPASFQILIYPQNI